MEIVLVMSKTPIFVGCLREELRGPQPPPPGAAVVLGWSNYKTGEGKTILGVLVSEVQKAFRAIQGVKHSSQE